MSDFHPFRMTPPAPPPVPQRGPPADLITVMHAGICRHCKQWVQADDVFLELRKLDRVICLGCYHRITGTLPRLGAAVQTDTIAAAGKD